MESVEKILDDIKFTINKFNPMKALQAERKLMSILIPIVSGIFSGKDKESDGKSILDSNIDFSMIGESFQKAFGSLSELEFENLVIQTLSNIQAEILNSPPVQINNKENFNKVFINITSLTTIYKLIFEVMKVNKFCFFDILGGGNATGIIDSLTQQFKQQKTTSKKLAK